MEYVDTKDRTFETRLKFIKDIFTNKFLQHEILTSSVNYKLLGTFERMKKEVDQSASTLLHKDPLKVLKKESK